MSRPIRRSRTEGARLDESRRMATKPETNADIQPERLRSLLKDLIDIYSPSGKEEEVLEFTEDYLRKHGLPVEREPVDDNRFNLVMIPEKTEKVELCFVGHLDTVTAYDLDDYGFHEENGRVSGLGTVDMKAGCAAVIEAFAALAETSSLPRSVGLALVVGEEQEGDGAKTLIR